MELNIVCVRMEKNRKENGRILEIEKGKVTELCWFLRFEYI